MKKAVAVIRFEEHVVRRTIALIIASVLCLIAMKPFVKLMLDILKNSKIFLDYPLEKIKIGEYGDCDTLGYGYIKKIVSPIPDLNLFPVTRYSTYNLFPDVLFSDSRYRYDDKILIGIDIDKDATSETLISQAVLNSVETNPARSKWAFQTGMDYDLLTGFVFRFKNDLPIQNQNMVVVLYDSSKNFEEIGRWVIKIPDTPSLSFSYKLEKPIGHFSFGRGGTDFIVVIENPNINDTQAIQVSALEILGVKVDMTNYTIFHKDFGHEERCFAAIKTSFFQEVYKNNYTEWKKYLNEVSNVEPIK